MDDARYVLFQDMKERNAAKRGAYAKVRGGGRHVRMPSDSLTRKEKRKLNGEVNTIRLAEPMTWSEYLKLPDDLRREYIKKLDERFAQTNGMLADMFGVSSITVCRLRSDLGLPRPTGKAHPLVGQVKAWQEFINPVKEDAESEATECDPDENGASKASLPNSVEPAQKDTVAQITALLSALVGSGAKLTLEVTL